MTFSETEQESFNPDLFEFDRSVAQRYAEWSISTDYPGYNVRIGLQSEHKNPSLELVWGGENHLDPHPDFLGQVWCVYGEHPESPVTVLVVAATAGTYPLKTITLPSGVTAYEGTRHFLDHAIREMLAAAATAWKVAAMLSTALAEGCLKYLHIETIFNEESEIETVRTRILDIDTPQNETLYFPTEDIVQTTVDDFLHLIFPDNTKPPLLNQIGKLQSQRIHELALAYLRHSVPEEDSLQAAHLLAYQQAAFYGFLQNHTDIFEFCNHLEIYLVLLCNECHVQFTNYQSNLLELSQKYYRSRNLTDLTPQKYRYLAEKASQMLFGKTCSSDTETIHTIFVQEVSKSRKFIDGKREETQQSNFQAPINPKKIMESHHPGAISFEVQKGAEIAYQTTLKKFGRKDEFGGRERIGFALIDPSLSREDMQCLIQQRNANNEIHFENESDGVLQVLKNFNALPSCEKSRGRTYVTSYLRSAKETIENPSGAVAQTFDAVRNRIFIFRREISENGKISIVEARVRVTSYGRVSLQSYDVVGSDSWLI
jgi:hypothetical protein